MDITDVNRNVHKHKRPTRKGIGRGSGLGKTSGKGHKGARSRSGWSSRLAYGGQMPLFRRLPRRGFNNTRFANLFATVNVGKLDKLDAGAVVTPELLAERGILRKADAQVKVLGDGELTTALEVHAHAFSKSAAAKIEQAGGKAVRLPSKTPFRRNKHPKTSPLAAEEPEVT